MEDELWRTNSLKWMLGPASRWPNSNNRRGSPTSKNRGYGHTVPTGLGVDVLFFTFAGPWLKPALAMKGIFDLIEQRNAAFTLIDKYNAMLAELAAQHDKFHHVDLRSMIDPGNDWVDELHLCNNAFARVAQRIDAFIRSL